MQGYTLHRKLDKECVERGKKAATYENVFDIIDEVHETLSLVKAICFLYNYLQREWFGIMEKVFQVRHDWCPTCLNLLRAPKAELFWTITNYYI